ncbi:DUF418 domain-containing protein [Nocardioides sp. S-58]|uniref:DUF418 domain-containing protein n=1 Tax=Nocardioides renjunii TaxID=3095075 RepID=A0ABU5KBP2_9ACTN|nr:DUF418 domain-containing protein [Nocardioides sp. S-58]MDZ5662306.1 DUF418 domain-containing protein [Nocardioides sp. S-58]
MVNPPPGSTPSLSRLPGLDMARFLAVAGMVLVHARDVLAQDAAGSAALWLEISQSIATNRARLLFFLLAGVGVALMSRRQGAGAGVLLRRALFLALLGTGLALVGWGDLILVFYGVLFVVAVLLMRLDSRSLLAIAAVVAAAGVLRLAASPFADDTLTNVLLLVGEMVPLLCIGLVIGRADLTNDAYLVRLGAVGALMALPALAFLAHTGAWDITEVEGRVEPAAALVSTMGLSVVVLALCLRIVPRKAGWWSPLVAAGGMPLTAYVGHALLFTVLTRTADWDLGTATGVAAGYLAVLALVAGPWRTWRGSGPIEALMRRVSRPTPPGLINDARMKPVE